jgi:hypothetical protein
VPCQNSALLAYPPSLASAGTGASATSRQTRPASAFFSAWPPSTMADATAGLGLAGAWPAQQADALPQQTSAGGSGGGGGDWTALLRTYAGGFDPDVAPATYGAQGGAARAQGGSDYGGGYGAGIYGVDGLGGDGYASYAGHQASGGGEYRGDAGWLQPWGSNDAGWAAHAGWATAAGSGSGGEGLATGWSGGTAGGGWAAGWPQTDGGMDGGGGLSGGGGL